MNFILVKLDHVGIFNNCITCLRIVWYFPLGTKFHRALQAGILLSCAQVVKTLFFQIKDHLIEAWAELRRRMAAEVRPEQLVV